MVGVAPEHVTAAMEGSRVGSRRLIAATDEAITIWAAMEGSRVGSRRKNSGKSHVYIANAAMEGSRVGSRRRLVDVHAEQPVNGPQWRGAGSAPGGRG